MKQLFENWRRSLNERETDELYNEIGNYFIDIIKDYKKYFRIIDLERDRDYSRSIGLPETPAQVFLSMKINIDAFDEQEFLRYKELTGDNKIMPEVEIFGDAMNKFSIRWAEEEMRPDASMDMNTNGQMTVYSRGEGRSVEEAIAALLSWRKSVFVHELAHWFNAIRSKYTKFRTSGMGKKTAKTRVAKDQAYAQSTEEMQARFIAVFNDVKEKLENESWSAEFSQSILDGDARQFLSQVVSLYGRELYYAQLEKPQKKRIDKRIIDMFNYFIKNKEKYPSFRTEPVPVLEQKMKQLTEYIEELEEESRAIDHGSFAIRDALHNQVWDENDKLVSDVREKLMKIAQDFWAKLELDWNEVMDVTFTGSLANYNWSRHSDIDLHLVVDFESVDENTQLVRDYFNAIKSNWNRRHNIFLKGFEVEIYVQDVSEIHKSTGVYSVSKDEWTVKPIKKEVNIDWSDVKKKAESLMNMIDEVENLMNSTHYKTAHRFGKRLKDKLKKFRRCGLDREGEYSSENIAFKALRRNGYVEKLMDSVVDSYDNMMSGQDQTHVRLKELRRRGEFQKKN